MSSNKIVVTVAVTGSFNDRSNPVIPVTPQEIAESALRAQEAGAAVAHIHVRDEETGRPSMRFELYEEVVQRIRERSDLIINLTTGPGGRLIPDDQDPVGMGPGTGMRSPEKRVEHVVKLKPELCSLDVGSMNFGPQVFVNYPPHIEKMAEYIRDAGVKPELEVFDMGHVEIGKHLIKTGRVLDPPIFQLCLGISWGMPATPRDMVFMQAALPPNAIWAGFGIGATAFNMVAQSALLGGNVRIGIEDTLHLAKGQPTTSNADLVEKAVKIIRILGKEPATSEEARGLLGLK